MIKGLSRKHMLQTAEKSAAERTEVSLSIFHNRIKFTAVVISLLFIVLAIRIVELNIYGAYAVKSQITHSKEHDFLLKRGDIVDRNGALLATNLSTASLFINAKETIEPELSAKQLYSVLQDIPVNELYSKFTSGKTFHWIKRHITPDEQQKVHNLGLPGLYFTRDEKRIYPQANLFSHTIGVVDVDGNGISGLEKQFDDMLMLSDGKHQTLQTTLDLRIQSIVHEELKNAVELNEALGGSAIIMDVNNGEIISMVSLPDYDPHHIQKTNERQRFNQNTLGVYEMGSTMKLTTIATAIDTSAVNFKDAFDVSTPFQLASYKITDYSKKNGTLTVPEVLMYSSNIGTAKIVERIGKNSQQNYINKFGMLTKVKVELPETSAPLYPSDKRWNQVSMITISYGYGLSITPLHVIKAISAMVNGGMLYEPTIIKKTGKHEGTRVIKPDTSEYMRKMMRLIVQYGGGKRANIPGYFVGGKTGTSEVLVNGRYLKRSNIGSFVGAFPINDPKYAIIVLIDQAKANKYNNWLTIGGIVAAPVAGNIIKRSGPLLGVWPQEDQTEQVDKDLALDFTPSYKPLVPATQ